MRGNYGLYFNVWDRLMGTQSTAYVETFEAVTSAQARHCTVNVTVVSTRR